MTRTVCYETPVRRGRRLLDHTGDVVEYDRHTIEYDPKASWYSRWLVAHNRAGDDRPVILDRYATYTEARRALARRTAAERTSR